MVPAIEAMNGLPGRAYPAGVGGVVGKPAFVFGLGDITEWPTRAARGTYERLVLMGAGVVYPPSRKLGNAFLAAVYDPDGNMIGLSQRGGVDGAAD